MRKTKEPVSLPETLIVRRVANGYCVQLNAFATEGETYIATDIFDLYEILSALFTDGEVN